MHPNSEMDSFPECSCVFNFPFSSEVNTQHTLPVSRFKFASNFTWQSLPLLRNSFLRIFSKRSQVCLILSLQPPDRHLRLQRIFFPSFGRENPAQQHARLEAAGRIHSWSVLRLVAAVSVLVGACYATTMTVTPLQAVPLQGS
jgi:hypothetical protein